MWGVLREEGEIAGWKRSSSQRESAWACVRKVELCQCCVCTGDDQEARTKQA